MLRSVLCALQLYSALRELHGALASSLRKSFQQLCWRRLQLRKLRAGSLQLLKKGLYCCLLGIGLLCRGRELC